MLFLHKNKAANEEIFWCPNLNKSCCLYFDNDSRKITLVFFHWVQLWRVLEIHRRETRIEIAGHEKTERSQVEASDHVWLNPRTLYMVIVKLVLSKKWNRFNSKGKSLYYEDPEDECILIFLPTVRITGLLNNTLEMLFDRLNLLPNFR